MKVLVKEWIDNNCEYYIYDLDKFDDLISFEKAYKEAILQSVKSKKPTVSTHKDRYDSYSDGCGKIEKLRLEPPCAIDAQAELILE